MAEITVSWTENQTLQSAQTLSASSSDTDNIDLDANGFDQVLITWKGTFNVSATDGCTIEIFASPDNGTTEDTIPLYSIEVEVDAGNTVIISLAVKDVPYIAVKRTNNDSSYDITNETVLYAGRKWSST